MRDKIFMLLVEVAAIMGAFILIWVFICGVLPELLEKELPVSPGPYSAHEYKVESQ